METRGEAAALNPQDSGSIPDFSPKIPILHCTICRAPIEEKRARRQTATCGEPCKDRLDAVRKEQRRNTKCPSCLHPSSPEEREEFRLWRATRGDLRTAEFVPRDKSTAYKSELTKALRAAVALLEGQLDVIVDSNCPRAPGGIPLLEAMDELAQVAYEKLDSEIQRFKKLLDSKGKE